MTKKMAAIGGFVLGSAVTIAVSKYLSRKKEERDDAIPPLSPSASRSLSVARNMTTTTARGGGFVISTTSDENVGFFSDIIRELWSFIDVAGSKIIRESCEEIFETMSPKIHFTKVELGSVPLRLDNILIHPVKDGCVRMELDVIWDGDCDMELKCNVLHFGVEKLKLSGRMSVLFKPLTEELPIVGAIQYAFINPPQMYLDFTGLAQIAEFKMLENTVQSTIQGSLSSLVLPNRSIYKMDDKFKLFDIYEAPLGIARITIVSGSGYVVEKRSLRSDDIPDVYCNVTLGNSRTFKTSTIKDNLSPVWNESADFLLSDNDQVIEVHAWDEDKGALDADDDLGVARISVGEVLLAGRTKTVQLQQDHRSTGANITLSCDVLELTTDAASLKEAKTAKDPNALYGLLTILVQGAYDLPLKKETASSFVRVKCAGEQFETSAVVDYPGVDPLNPIFESAFHVPLTFDKVGSDVVLELLNGVDPKLQVLGSTTVTFESLMNTSSKTLTAQHPIGNKGASLEFQVSLRGVAALPPASSTPPKGPSIRAGVGSTPSSPVMQGVEEGGQGTVRLTAVKGRGFPIQRRRLKKADIPDVYLQIRFGSSPTVWRTATIKNSTEPNWNESKNFTLLHHSQIIHIDAFDEDKGSRDPDDELGTGRVAIGKVLLAGGTLELELQQAGKPTGRFITLRSDMVDAASGEPPVFKKTL